MLLLVFGFAFWLLAAFVTRLSCQVLRVSRPWMQVFAVITAVSLALAGAAMKIDPYLNPSTANTHPEGATYVTSTLFLCGLFSLFGSFPVVDLLFRHPDTE